MGKLELINLMLHNLVYYIYRCVSEAMLKFNSDISTDDESQ